MIFNNYRGLKICLTHVDGYCDGIMNYFIQPSASCNMLFCYIGVFITDSVFISRICCFNYSRGSYGNYILVHYRNISRSSNIYE